MLYPVVKHVGSHWTDSQSSEHEVQPTFVTMDTEEREKNNGPAIVKPTFVTMKLKHILVETSRMLSTYSKYL